jgi:choice-of-anchor C domain-containing protein
MMRRVLAAAMLLAIGSARQASAAPFTNGSFELGSVDPGMYQTLGVGSTAITGWEVIGSNIDYVGSFWQASDGSRSLDLNGNNGPGGIRQTFDTVAGQAYAVLIDVAAHHPPGLDRFQLHVDFNGLRSGLGFGVDPDSTPADMHWRTFIFGWYIATGDLSTLSIISDTADPVYGPAIDNIRVVRPEDLFPPTTVPEPTTLSLLGLGLAGIAVRRSRSRSHVPQ